MTTSPSVAVDANGDQFVFWAGGDSQLWESWYEGGTWYGPLLLGFGPLGSSPTAGVDASGGQYVWWRGTDGGLWEAWYVAGWHGPIEVPRTVGLLVSAPSVAMGSACEYVFFQGPYNHVWESWYCNGWYGPAQVPVASYVVAGAPTAAIDASGGQYVWWLGQGNGLQEAWYVNSQWHGPYTVPNTGVLGSPPAAAVSTGGQFVFWEGTDANLWESWYVNGTWNGPERISLGPMGSAPTVGVDGAGSQYVFWSWQDGNVHEVWYVSGNWHGPILAITPIMGCNDSYRGNTSGNWWDGWSGLTGNAGISVGGTYAKLYVYSPGVIGGESTAWTMLVYAYDGYYAQVGYTESPGGVRSTFVEVNDAGGFIANDNAAPPQTPGTWHYYTTLLDNEPGHYTFYVDSTEVESIPAFIPNPDQAQQYGEVLNIGNQMPGGTRQNVVMTDSKTWFGAPSTGQGSWEPFGYYAADPYSSNSNYYGNNEDSSTQMRIWDVACQ